MYNYLLLALYAVIAIQCSYYLLYLSPLFDSKKTKVKNSDPISVIICAKNEASNLKQFLPSILSQNYSGSFEVVLINDRSIDETSEIIDEFSKKYSNIKIVNIEECENFYGNKKYALTLGIKAASYENLLFTDADCKPISNNWIQNMSDYFSTDKSIILGYGSYKKINNSVLNKLIRFETIITAIQYFSYAKLGNPYMGVGRNLAYKKSEFFKVNGFVKHMNILSGDDDLFVNEIATKSNTIYTLDHESYTESLPKKTFKNWMYQKQRHVSTSSHYKLNHKILLGLFYISQMSFFILSIILLYLTKNIYSIIIPIFIRYIFFYISVGLFSKKIKSLDIIRYLPFLEIMLIIVQLYIYLKNKVSAPIQWN